jgi:hypothetical protein
MDVKTALRSEESLRAFTSLWLACELPASAWTHEAHILTAAWFLTQHPQHEVRELMRAHIPRYNVATGGANTPDSGYHDTLTCFWVAKIAVFLRGCAGANARDQVEAAVAHFGARRDWFRDHYSFDVVRHREARARWIEPDLRPIS